MLWKQNFYFVRLVYGSLILKWWKSSWGWIIFRNWSLCVSCLTLSNYYINVLDFESLEFFLIDLLLPIIKLILLLPLALSLFELVWGHGVLPNLSSFSIPATWNITIMLYHSFQIPAWMTAACSIISVKQMLPHQIIWFPFYLFVELLKWLPFSTSNKIL